MENQAPVPSTPKEPKKGISLLAILLIVIAVGLIGSIVFIGLKLAESNEKIVLVDEESNKRDDILDKKIEDLNSAVADSLEAVSEKLAEMEAKFNGQIWYLQDQINKNKKAVEELSVVVEDLKVQPVVVADEPVKKPKKKNQRSSGFDFSELENIGEEFEEMFQ